MKTLERVFLSCTLLLFAFQCDLAYRLCSSASASGGPIICADRFKGAYVNIVTLVCSTNWSGETQFFRSPDNRIVNSDIPTESYDGKVYMTMKMTPSMEGTYLCRSKIDSSLASAGIPLLAYPEIESYSSLVRAPSGTSVSIVRPFELGSLTRDSSNVAILCTSDVGGNRMALSGATCSWTIANATKSNAGVYNFSVMYSDFTSMTITVSYTLEVYVQLQIIYSAQSKRVAFIRESTDNPNTDNIFHCKVQFGSSFSSDVPDVKWYLNDDLVGKIPGSHRFQVSEQPVVSINELNKTVESILSVTQGQVQDSGVYKCQSSWLGSTFTQSFNFAIIGRPSFSILKMLDKKLYLNVTLYPSIIPQPWYLAVQFKDVNSKAVLSTIYLDGVNSSPLYLVPSDQMPSSESYTVAVAVKADGSIGLYSTEVNMPGTSPCPSSSPIPPALSCGFVDAFKNQPKIIAIVVTPPAFLVLLAFLAIAYWCGTKQRGQACVNDTGRNCNGSVMADCCRNKEPARPPLMVEYCWQAKYLEEGLRSVLEKRDQFLDRMFNHSSEHEPWQGQYMREDLPPSYVDNNPVPSSRCDATYDKDSECIVYGSNAA